jgi:hypothetical protein
MAKGMNVAVTGVVKGTIAPNKADALKVAARVRRDLNKNPKLRKQFWKNPRGVLGAYGLNADVQRELLQDAGVSEAGAICVFTDCIHTCWFTKCYVTHIVIKRD